MEATMNQRLLLTTGAAMLSVASFGAAQEVQPPAAGQIPPSYVPGQPLGVPGRAGALGLAAPAIGQAGPPLPRIGAVAPTLGIPGKAPLALVPWAAAKPNKHPQAVDNPAITGGLKPYKYGYGLSRFDVTPTPGGPGVPGKYDLPPTTADR
jgi:hypothetical protein